MIDLKNEQVITIQEAPTHIPGRPSLATVWRWVLSGTRAGKLESLLIGGRRFTSVEAIQRFADRGTAHANNEPTATPTPRQRQRAMERAEKESAEAGI